MNDDLHESAATITGIEPLSDRPDRSRIDLSDGRWFEIEHTHPHRASLRIGMPAETPDVEALIHDHQRRTIRTEALDLLGRRDHLSTELRERLATHDRELVGLEVAALLEDGWIDDQGLARRRISKWRDEGRSDRECRDRLQNAGLDPSTIDAAIRAREGDEDPVPNEASALERLIERRGTRLRELDATALRKHVARWSRRGFEPDTIRSVLRHYDGLDATLDASIPNAFPEDVS